MEGLAGKWGLVLCMFLWLPGCTKQQDEAKGHGALIPGIDCPPPSGIPRVVELATLTNKPSAAMEGVFVKVEGLYVSGVEVSALYPKGSSLTSTDYESGLWLLGAHRFSRFRGQLVLVEGFYTMKTKGHLSQWPGSICVTGMALTAGDAPSTTLTAIAARWRERKE